MREIVEGWREEEREGRWMLGEEPKTGDIIATPAGIVTTFAFRKNQTPAHEGSGAPCHLCNRDHTKAVRPFFFGRVLGWYGRVAASWGGGGGS